MRFMKSSNTGEVHIISRISSLKKIEDPENNLTYYLIPDETYGPCTIGFFRQKIVIPESFPLHPDFVMVYKHEGAHLKNHDNLVKLLCLLVLCVHWMNPVAYLLLLLYIDTAEIVSDSAAVEGCSKEKRQRLRQTAGVRSLNFGHTSGCMEK